LNPKLILMVEDDSDDEALMIRALKKNKIASEVVVAHDGVEALDFLFGAGSHAGRDLSRQPDVVLLDLQLPRLGGLKVLQKIRADERTRLLPVVVLTSSKEDKDVLDAYKLGADSFVQKSMVLMIEDLLDLSRITHRRMKHDETDLSALAHEAASDLRRQERQSKVEFSAQEGLKVRGDPGMLKNLLMNLIGNAWKYESRHGIAKVKFGLDSEEGDGAFFVRGDGEVTGPGKGLAAVYRIIARHGGRVWSKSDPGKSTTFYFTLAPKKGDS
jgi:two-component system, response regulator